MYVDEWDVYMCPNLYPMHYKTTSRQGYSEYESLPENCANCPKKEKCLYKGQSNRIIRRHIEMWFKTESEAQAQGFSRSQR